MRMRDLAGEVLRNLVRRKLRTALTTLGIAIGALTIALIFALGSGLQSFIHLQIGALADPRVIQVLGSKDLPLASVLKNTLGRLGRTPREIGKGGFNLGAFNLRYISPEEVEAIRKIPHVESVTPATMVFTNFIQLEGDSRQFEVVVIPRNEGFRMQLAFGPGFSENGTNEVVLAWQYLDAFDIKDPSKLIGRKVKFGVSRFPLVMKGSGLAALFGDKEEKIFEAKVVGLAEKTLLSMAAYVDNDLAISIARYFLADPELHTPGKFGLAANVRVDSREHVMQVKQAITKVGLTSITVQERIGVLETVFYVVQMGLFIFGAIALVVAGLGIANTLLMATYERRREIGLMKALGMTNAAVRNIFALEAVAIGMLGGVIGLVAAYAIGAFGNFLATHTFAEAWEGLKLFAFPWWLFAGVTLFSAAVGLLAGLYPAMRAARLDPIRALRAE